MKVCPDCDYKAKEPETMCPKCNKLLLTIHQTDWSGTILESKYRILRKIGGGGMGVVYEAEQIPLERRVAIKFLRSEFCDDPETVRRFLREARAAARLDHSHIVTIHDFSQTDDGIVFIAMEFLEKGRDLKAEIREKGRLSLEETTEILHEICLALAHAHEHGVIHRDIKPENIFLQQKGDRRIVKILDFGIAKIRGGQTQTIKGVIAGTPEYMSPEQLRGEPVDASCDLYSLACVLYECLTGKPPFTGKTLMEIAMMHLNAAHVSATQQCPELPKDVDGFFKKALAKQPGERFGSAREIYEAFLKIQQTQAQRTILMYSDQKSETKKSQYTDKRQKFNAVLLFVLIAVIGLGIVFNQIHDISLRNYAENATDVVETLEITTIPAVDILEPPEPANHVEKVDEQIPISESKDSDFIIMEFTDTRPVATPRIMSVFSEPPVAEISNRPIFVPRVDGAHIRERVKKEFKEIKLPVQDRDEEDIFSIKKY